MAFGTELPVHRDPLRVYDRLERNQPRRLGFMELVVRPFPWVLQMFTARVPDDWVAQVDIDRVEVPCPCKAVTSIKHNIATPCEGNCGRWFWYFADAVRVAYESPEDQDDSEQHQRDHEDAADEDR